MGMQTAYLNQPYAAPTGYPTGYPSMGVIPGAASNTLASYVIPLSAPPAPAASQSMTQLPNVPRPPFLNSLSNPAVPYSTAQSVPFAPTAPTSGGLGSLPDIPTPAQLLGTASAGGLAGSQGTAFNTGMPATTAMNAGPYPNIEALPEIPPPHIAAPWVYLQRGKNPPQLPPYPYGYGGAGTPAVASQPQAKSSMGQPGNTPMGAPQPPPRPPVQGTPQAPPPQQPPQQPPAQPQQKKPSVDLDEDALSDETIKALNKRLEDPVEGVRSDATIDLFKILEKNPKLAENPNYKPYIDAFVEKIMQDPSPVVRAGGELILKMGEIPNPSPVVQSRLNELSQKTDLTSEGEVASDILRDYETGSMKKKKAPPPPAEPDPNANPNNPQAGTKPDNSSLSSHKNTMSSIPLDGSGLSWQSGPIPGTDVQPPAPAPPPADPPPDGAQPQFSGRAGNKLNMMSPQQAVKAGSANSTPAGQRLNIQGV